MIRVVRRLYDPGRPMELALRCDAPGCRCETFAVEECRDPLALDPAVRDLRLRADAEGWRPCPKFDPRGNPIGIGDMCFNCYLRHREHIRRRRWTR